MTAPTVAELVAGRADDPNFGLRFEDATWTWAEVVGECAARAAALDAIRGPDPFHVGVLLDNVPEFVYLLGGAALAGATVVGINPTRRGEELAADVRHTDCQLIVTEASHAPSLRGLDLGIGPERVLDHESTAWRSLVDAHRGAALPPALPDPDTLFVLLFTSGSTGAPKAVRGTQGRYGSVAGSMGFGPGDVLYSTMPLFHGNALAASFVPALVSGAAIALRRRFSASAFMPDVRRVGATYFNVVGRALSYVLATPPSDDDRHHRVKFALAPETSPADARAFTERFGIPLVGGYGASEGVIVIHPVPDAKPGALGRAAPGQDVAVVDPSTGEECPRADVDDRGGLTDADAVIGEIVRRDPELRFEGYYDNDAATAERNRNGWYWSGDLGYRDTDGIFYFAGRTADWIRVDGENFAAAPIERIVARHPGVAAVAVYGVPDPVTGDQVMAAVEPRGPDLDLAALSAFLDEQPDLGTKWKPRFVVIVPQLPTTGADKIDKKPLRAAAWTTALGPVWWRRGTGSGYEPLATADAEALTAAFREHGRAHLLPVR